MAEIVELKARPARVIASVVKRLEEILAEAKEGKIQSVAIACIHDTGEAGASWSETDNFSALLGAITRLQHRINVNQDKVTYTVT